MIEFYARFVRTLFKDEATGDATFIVESDDNRLPRKKGYSGIKCVGRIINLPKGMPVKIVGETSGTNDIIVNSICPQTNGEAATLSFLENRLFYGIGPSVASSIVKEFGYNIFDFCKKESAINELERIPGVTKKIANNLVYKVREYENLQELVEYLTSFGATYSSAKKIYETYGSDAIDMIEKNPYILYFAGVNYENREAIAKKNQIDDLDERRIGAIIHEAMDRIESAGNTCGTFKDVMEEIVFIEKSSNMGYVSSPISVLSYILSHKNKFEIKTYDNRTFIYRKYMSEIEEKVAKNVLRICNSSTFNGIIKPIEMEDIKFDKTQKDAFSLLDQSGIAILTGGPGTGKSTLIKGFIKSYKKEFPDKTVALCAPTGAAAKRLKEVTGERAVTIHKLLNIRPYGTKEYKFKNEKNPLIYDFIIVDEFSMVDTELFSMLTSAIKSGALLLLVGDEDQLPSVGAGNVLKELLENGLIRVKRLNKVHRQSGESTILKNSIKVRDGDPNIETDKTFIIERVSSTLEMEKLALEYMKKAVQKKDKFKIKLYSPIKKKEYNVGTFNLNSKIHGIANKESNNSFIYNGVKFSINDPVIMLRNNYKKGYLNGDEGFITNISKNNNEEISVEIELLDNQKVILKENEFSDMDLGYCITIHKSQGNESDAGIILVPEKPVGLLERSLIYVALTRAKKQNIIITENYAFEKAIQRNNSINRKTNLNNRCKKLLIVNN